MWYRNRFGVEVCNVGFHDQIIWLWQLIHLIVSLVKKPVHSNFSPRTFQPEFFQRVSVDHLCHQNSLQHFPVSRGLEVLEKNTDQPTNRCFPWCREDEGCKANFTRMYLGWQQKVTGSNLMGPSCEGSEPSWEDDEGFLPFQLWSESYILDIYIYIIYIFSHKNHKEHDVFNFKLR